MIDEAIIHAFEKINVDDPKFQELQSFISQKLGRNLVPAERLKLTAALRKRKETLIASSRLVQNELECNQIMIFTAYSEDYSIGRICEAVNRQYASSNGYIFFSDVKKYEQIIDIINPRSHCTWYKIHMINQLLNDFEMIKSKNLQYIMWIDADAIFINHDIKIENLIQKYGFLDLFISEDVNQGCLINAGVLLIKISDWSRSLWKDVWESPMCSKYHNVYFYEQSALLRCLKQRREGLSETKPFHSFVGGPRVKLFAHTCVLPHDEFNSNAGAADLLLMGSLSTPHSDLLVVPSNELAQSPDGNILDFGEDSLTITSVPPTKQTSDVLQSPCVASTSSSRKIKASFIFHAIGQWNKLEVLKSVILHWSVPYDPSFDLGSVLEFRLFRGRCGSVPTAHAVAARKEANEKAESTTI